MKLLMSIGVRLFSLTFLVSATALWAAPGYMSGQPLPTTVSQTILAQDHGVIANDGIDDAANIQAIIDSICLLYTSPSPRD